MYCVPKGGLACTVSMGVSISTLHGITVPFAGQWLTANHCRWFTNRCRRHIPSRLRSHRGLVYDGLWTGAVMAVRSGPLCCVPVSVTGQRQDCGVQRVSCCALIRDCFFQTLVDLGTPYYTVLNIVLYTSLYRVMR